MAASRILVIRLGSMGDVIHALPAVASLKRSFPDSALDWVIHPRWAPLLEGNPYVTEVIPFDRRGGQLRASLKRLRQERYDVAVDFQGLIQSALLARVARAQRVVGLDSTRARESLAALFYSIRVHTLAAHRVDSCLELAAAAGATTQSNQFPLPPGYPEGSLPDGKFVLACPQAGWGSKQWPRESYESLAAALQQDFGMPLVVNGAPQSASWLGGIRGAQVHLSGLQGLIHAARRAHAIVGVDSGPLHLAAALAKPGVAIFGPTDPASHGPYGGTIRVLRAPHAITTYKRRKDIDPSMRAVTPAMVLEALSVVLAEAATGKRTA
jgi:heptosyltransferase I